MLRVRLFGEMALEADGDRLEPPGRRSGRSLLAYLALHPGLHARADLAARLWPDAAPDSARASLRTALTSVRRALGERAPSALAVTRDRVGFDADVAVDAVDFRRLVAAGRLEEALELASGEFLQGLDEGWVVEAREDHLRELVEALAEVAARYEEQGDLDAAVQHTRSAVALDGLSESSSRALMRRLAGAGDRAAALAAYDRLRERLWQELGVAPSPVTRELAERIRGAGGGGGAPPPPAIPSAERLTRDALELARRSGDASALSNALDTAHVLLAGTGGGERLALAEEMISLGERSGRIDLLARGRIRRGVDLLERGDLRGVAEERDALERIAAETGEAAYGWWPALWSASESILRGDSEIAARLARHAFEVGRRAYPAEAELELRAQLFWIRWQDGAYEELAAAAAAEAERFESTTPTWRCAQAAVVARIGDLDLARALIDDLAGPRLPLVRADSAWPVGATMLAEACAASGHARAAATLYGALEPIAGRWACGATGSLCICPISRSLGLLAAAMERWGDADRHFDDALARAEAAGAAKLAARTRAERRPSN